METVVKLEGINKTVGQEQILKNINLEIYKGEFLSIIGPSGSGKSSLLYIIGLLDRPTSGRVMIEDVEVNFSDNKQLSNLRNKKFGFVFQFHYLINELTLYENVMVPMIKAGYSLKSAKEKAFYLLERVGLKGKEHRKPFQISGGEQQRVSIARSLSNSPDLIVADEPTGNLDSKNTQVVMEIFKELNTEGKTIVMVTHEMELANQTTRTISMRDGEIV